jgi:hypothetical protein
MILATLASVRAQSAWLQARITDIKQAEHMEPGEKFQKIGRLVRLAEGTHRTVDQEVVLEKARSMMLATPGYGIYYLTRYRTIRDLVIAGRISSSELDRARADLETLQYLQSSESVQVLAELLSDTYGRDLTRSADAPELLIEGRGPPTAKIAANGMRAIGIANGPSLPKGLTEWQMVDRWKDWWGEIEAGKRTYRFVGSPVEYGPDGPASEQTLERIAKTRKRDSERMEGRRKPPAVTESARTAAGENSNFLPVAGAIAGLALCAAAVRHFLKARRNHVP